MYPFLTKYFTRTFLKPLLLTNKYTYILYKLAAVVIAMIYINILRKKKSNKHTKCCILFKC